MLTETKKILWLRDVTFAEDSTPQGALVDGQSGRNEDNVVVLDQSTKSPIFVLDDEDEDELDAKQDARSTLKSKNWVAVSSNVVEEDYS